MTNIKVRRGTASLWTSTNPVLSDGELGLETDTGKVKFGNGAAAWTALSYAVPGGSGLQTLDPSGAWSGWKSALANQAATPIRWLALGDSITEGTGVTSRSDTWVSTVARKIREAFPSIPGNAATNSIGWTPIISTSTTLASPWTVAGSYDTASTFGFRASSTARLNQNATITGSVTGTSIDIWHAKGAATGTFTVKVNGNQVGGNYGGTNATTTSGFVQRVTLGAAATYTVVITCNSANPVYINGVTMFNGNETSGVIPHNAGRHGWVSQDWEDVANSAYWASDIATLNPHLVTILIGANDYTSAVGRVAFKANLTTVIEKLRDDAVYWPSIVLIACYKRSETATPRWEHYEYSLQQLATELGCGYIDLRDVMPDVGTQEAIDNAYYVDTVHPSDTGSMRVADEVVRVLLDPNLGRVAVDPNPVHANATTLAAGFMSTADKVKIDSGLMSLTMSKQYKVVACVVRNTGSGFQFISDGSHVPVNCLSIATAGDQLSFTITFNFTASKVVSMVGTPDETLGRKGYSMGASVGLSTATFYVGQGGGFGDYISWSGSAWTSLNGYITSTSMNGTTGLITCTHEDLSSPIAGQVTSRSLTKRASLEGLGATSTTLYLVDTSGVTVKTPTTDNRFWISRAGARRVKMDELDLANSNIWIYGVFEV
jgi:lysophospholipase L1-like esterase